MKNKGISLIVLIITIVVIIILATAVIINLYRTNIVKNANEAKFKQDITLLKEELNFYLLDKISNLENNYNPEKLNADKFEIIYDEEIQDGTIEDILFGIKNTEYLDKVVIEKGELLLDSQNVNKDGIKWASEIGVGVSYTKASKQLVKIIATPDTGWTAENVDVTFKINTIPQGYVIEYKVGEGEWIQCENGYTLSVEENVLIYARLYNSTTGEEIAFNQYNVDNIDKLPPNEPIINSHYGYATITPYNIIEDGGTTIIYDNSVSGTKNYYSLDDGVTWYEYNGKISISKYGNIMAKSVKPNGLETIVTKSIEAPNDALPEVCYDGDKGTYNELSSDNGTFAYWSSESKRIYVEDAPISVCVKYTNHQYCKITFNYYNDSDEKIDSVNLDAATWSYSEIPENTAYIDINMTQWSQSGKVASNCIYEIEVVQ